MSTIGVLGAGTWGIALSKLLADNQNAVTVWSALPQEIENLRATHIHPNLPDVVLPEQLDYTTDIQEVCRNKDILLFAVPSVFVRSTAAKAAPYIPDGQVIVDVAKGIEPDSLMTMTEIIASELTDHKDIRLVALSGPTHAEEVIKSLPTAIVSACSDLKTAQIVQTLFSSGCMRTYANTDVKGVELCGAFKNIIALASGISSGLGYGDNTRAALITRGMTEIARLGVAMGCAEATFYGLAGIGDLIVTATSHHSRNFKCGYLMGQGVPPDEAIKKVGMVVEGINAIPAAMQLKDRYQIEMPIVEAVHALVFCHSDPAETALGLMMRESKIENDKDNPDLRFEQSALNKHKRGE